MPATESWIDLWRALQQSSFEVKKWGTMNLGVGELEQLCKIKAPFVNELDVPDCTTLADDFTSFAKRNGTQLWPSGGGIGTGACIGGRRADIEDPLPSVELHNLLQEFQPVAASLAPSVDVSALSTLVPLAAEGTTYDPSVKPGVSVDWVLTVSDQSDVGADLAAVHPAVTVS